ncbi:MAG: succinate dehydrogenase [Thermoplasmata archaeon]|nr:succinate dehydrogenase [Thermoplasmata archaeon]
MPVTEWFRIKGWNLERTLFVLNRITGWAILAFLVVHIVFIHQIDAGQGAWGSLIAFDASPLGQVGLALVGAALIFHALNGTRVMLIEWNVLTPKPELTGYRGERWLEAKRHRTYVSLMFVIGIVLLVYATWVIFA